MVVNSELVRQAFQKLPTNAIFGKEIFKQWLSAHIYVKAIKISGYLSDDALDVKKINRAMSVSEIWDYTMHCYDGTNASGVWRVKYDNKYYYMITKPGEQVDYPSNIGKTWAKQIQEHEVDLLCHKRSMDDAALDNSDVLAKWPNLGPELQDTTAVDTQQLSHHLSTQTYWDSSESRRLFGAYNEDENTLIAINHKIEKLRSVNQTVDGYRNVVKGCDPHNICTQTQIFEI